MSTAISSERPEGPALFNIGIADAHTIVRWALRELFSTEGSFRVLGEAGNGRSALELARTPNLDLLVMDLDLPGRTGLEILSEVRITAPQVAILIFTACTAERYVLSAFRRGVCGFLFKTCELIEVLEAVRVVSQNSTYMPPAVAEMLTHQLDIQAAAPHSYLSEREFLVFLRLARGFGVHDIAQALAISEKTVSFFRGRVLEKLQLPSIGSLTRYAIQHRLFETL